MNLAMANSSVNASEQKCTMLVQFDRAPNQLELKRMLESDSAKTKADAMKQVIAMMLNGEQLGDLFFTIVRYVLPTDDHTVQRLLLLYLVSAAVSLACWIWAPKEVSAPHCIA